MFGKYISAAFWSLAIAYLTWGQLASRLGDGLSPTLIATELGLLFFGGGLWVIRRDRKNVPDIALPALPKGPSVISKMVWGLSSIVAVIVAMAIWAQFDFAVSGHALQIALGSGVATFLTFLLFSWFSTLVTLEETRDKAAKTTLEHADRLRQQARRQASGGAVGDAIAAYEAALAMERRYRPAEHLHVIETLIELSRALLRARQARDAIAYANEAKPLLVALSRRSSETAIVQLVIANNERTMGEAYMALGEYALAVPHFAASAAIWEQRLRDASPAVLSGFATGDELPIFDDLNHQALAAAQAGDATQAIAIEARSASLEINLIASYRFDRETLDEMAANSSMEGFAFVFWRPDKGLRDLQKSFALIAAARGAPTAEAHEDVGLAWEKFGALAVARHHYNQALAIVQSDFGPVSPECSRLLCRLGHIASLGSNNQAAARYFDHGLTCARGGAPDQILAWACTGLAEALFALDDLNRVAALAKEAIQLATNFLPQRARAYSILGELRGRLGTPESAIFLAKRAVNLAQKDLRGYAGSALEAGVREDNAVIFRRLASHLVDAGRIPEAQQVLDLLKDEEFDTFVTRKDNNDRSSAFIRLTAREISWTKHGDDLETEIETLLAERKQLLANANRNAVDVTRLESLYTLLDKAKQDLDDWLDALVDTLRAERPAAEQQVRALNLDLLETLRGDLAELGPGVAVVHFILGKDRLSIILTKPDLQVSRDVAVSGVEMNGLIHRFRRAMRSPTRDTSDLLRLSQTLYRHLIAPIAEYLTGVETVMATLDGALRYVPLAALHDGANYLIAKHGLTMLTPASQSRLKDAPKDWTIGGIAGLGVSRRSADHKPLPAVDEELRAIVREDGETAGIFPGKRYLDDAFTAGALAEALQSSQAIHIASHFNFAAAQDMASTLLLGDGTELTLHQLQADRYVFRNIELVTLSACETALGNEPAHGGILNGLHRLNGVEFESLGAMIQKRGAKAVIATLWAVEDNSTAQLMRLFYQARRDGATKAGALRIAQIALLDGGGNYERYSHPYFWAPFVLMGNWL